jgi:hypothetical protein
MNLGLWYVQVQGVNKNHLIKKKGTYDFPFGTALLQMRLWVYVFQTYGRSRGPFIPGHFISPSFLLSVFLWM